MSNVRSPATWPLHRPVDNPALAAKTAPDAARSLRQQPPRKAGETLLQRPAAAVVPVTNPPSLESIIAAVSSDEPANSRGSVWWGKPQFLLVGLALLAVVAPISVGMAVVMLSSDVPSLTLPPLGRTDQIPPAPAPPLALKASTAGANRLAPGAQRPQPQIAERTAPMRSEFNEDRPTPIPAALRVSGSPAGEKNRVVMVEPRKNPPAPEMGQFAPHRVATSPKPAPLAAPSSQAATSSPSPILAVSGAPVTLALAGARALAAANSRIAAVESERDALAAEVARLERHSEPGSPREANPSAPAVAASPTPLPAATPASGSSVDLSAALASLPQGMPARVLIRYAGNSAEARRRAEGLANALIGQGVAVADLRESAAAIRTELSFSYAPDEAIAQQVGRLVGVAPVRRLQSQDALMARPGTVELSLSGDNHLAAIKTTSNRESNHE